MFGNQSHYVPAGLAGRVAGVPAAKLERHVRATRGPGSVRVWPHAPESTELRVGDVLAVLSDRRYYRPRHVERVLRWAAARSSDELDRIA